MPCPVYSVEMKLLLLLVAVLRASLAYREVHSDQYLSLPALDKREILFNNCLENSSPADWFSSFRMLGLLVESMCPTLTARGDEMPEGRQKYIHTVGAVAQVQWQDLGGHNYTGLFTGADYGIVRLSLASEPDEDDLTTLPGMALKFLRDGMDSANLVAMNSLDGQESWNFFKHDFSNHIGPGSITNLPIKLIFASYAMHIQQVGLSDWSTHGQDRAPANNASFPYRLRFQPTGNITFSDKYTKPHTEDLVTIQNGTTLYQIFALDKPAEMGGTEMQIGDLVTVSKMVTSRWGDKQLFFRHQDMLEDLNIRPEWKDFTESFGFEHETDC